MLEPESKHHDLNHHLQGSEIAIDQRRSIDLEIIAKFQFKC